MTEGLYVAVAPAASISFHYNYSINGRQESITFGHFGVGIITLAKAREQLNDAKIMAGIGSRKEIALREGSEQR